MATQRLPDPSAPPNPGPPPGGGAYLLQLLQQRSSPPTESLANAGFNSFLSPMEASTFEEERLRCVLQHDPAVAALGPSHRLSEICSNGIDGGRGLLPLQDHQLQHPHNHHHNPVQFPVSPSPTFPGAIRPDQFLPSHMDPLLRPSLTTHNPFMRPYSYRAVDHGPYERVNSPSFGKAGVINPNRLQEKLNSSGTHVGPENSIFPRSFVHAGLPGHNMSSHNGTGNCSQENASNQHSNHQLRASNSSEAMRGFVQQGQQFYTQFGSVGVEIASQDHNRDLSFAPSTFQKASFLRKSIDSDDSVPSYVTVSKPKRVESFGGPVVLEDVKILHPDGRPISHFYQPANNRIVMEDNGKTGILMDGVIQSSSRFDLHSYGFSNISNNGVTDQQDAVGILTSKESLGICKFKSDQENNLKALGWKAANRNGFPHWESITKDKIVEDRGSETTLTVIQKRSSDHEIQKEKGKFPGWILKQSNATGFSEWQGCDLEVTKLNTPPKLSNIIRNDSRVQDSTTCLPSGTEIESAPSPATEQASHSLSIDEAEAISRQSFRKTTVSREETVHEENDETILSCIGCIELDEDNGSNEAPQILTSKSLREVERPSNRVGLFSKFNRREFFSRAVSEKCTNQFLSIFESLIPPADEELRRRKLLSTLEELISAVWPEARLYLFGSCANAFGVCNSDIDICLSIEGESLNRVDIVRKLADVLMANNMQNVQALTRARVPIVKYSDPKTGISCDVCVNNMLAVVNTKLLHDYAQIDVRLRQLAFLVKHWAKCRQVNETYRGTLSSYAYVLMCIHFLQQRNPPVLPCLQEMEPTYQVTVGAVKCAYFDKVDRLAGFGQKNKENLADLVALFFEYWAYVHDYSHTVISIRTGRHISKAEKNWTRRIGNERHLICIEDPFEVSHDLGRVVDKHSIRALRGEFKRAARIMRDSTNPWITLFEPFLRPKMEDDFATV